MDTLIKPEPLNAFCVEAMQRCGVRDPDARTTSDALVTMDAWGIHSHGTIALRKYMERIGAGGVSAQAIPQVVRESGAWAIVDGHDALGMVSASLAMRVAIEKARTAGIAYVGVRGGTHFGAAGYYAYLAAREQMIGLSMTNTDPVMAGVGSRGRILGNNPLAFAAPLGDGHPLLLDIAMSEVAGGRVVGALMEGREIPDHWLLDTEGRPTTDPAWFRREGALQPVGAHKGYGLAVMVEVLVAVLTGSGITDQIVPWTRRPESATNTGHAFVAIDISSIMPIDQFEERITHLCGKLRNADLADGAQAIKLPGQIEWDRYDKAMAHGMMLPHRVIESLEGLASDVKMDFAQCVNASAKGTSD